MKRRRKKNRIQRKDFALFQAIEAARERVKIMVGLSGIAGAGKTLSALKLAYGLTGDWTKIGVVDTENRSSLYYAGERTGAWKWIDFNSKMKEGYHPRNWMQVIQYAESLGLQALILDSITHEWEGKGGCLELVETIGRSGKGNSFTAWNQVTPLHRAFVDRMRESPLHIIATIRSKSDYVIEDGKDGKKTPRKVGMKTIQREGTDYEFGLIFDIDRSHHASCEKDRTGLFSERAPFIIGEDTGRELYEWANTGGEALKAPPPKPQQQQAKPQQQQRQAEQKRPLVRRDKQKEEVWSGTPYQLTWLVGYLKDTYAIENHDDVMSISNDLGGTPKGEIGIKVKEIVDAAYCEAPDPESKAHWDSLAIKPTPGSEAEATLDSQDNVNAAMWDGAL
jgi:hypothetical protein